MSRDTDETRTTWNLTELPDRRVFVLLLGTLIATLAGCRSRPDAQPEAVDGAGPTPDTEADASIALPDPIGTNLSGSLLDVIERRRSVRTFTERPVPEEHVASMLWAAQGVTDPARGLRAAPSAGALYPLELYVASIVGVRRYAPRRHELEHVDSSDIRVSLAAASLGQGFVAEAPVVFIITGIYARTADKYGERAAQYVHLEAGHAAQNLLLVAVSLGLGGVPIGAFVDDAVRQIIGAPEEETPLYVIPVGASRD